MSDTIKTGFPLDIAISAGEIPTNAKLTAIASQAKSGLSILERAIGDPWNQAADTFIGSTLNALMIPNISRLIGKAEKLNPMVYPSTAITTYTHTFGSDDVGKYEGYLSLRPATTTVTWGGTTSRTILRTTKEAVVATGDYYLDITSGYFYCFDAIVLEDTITYQPASNSTEKNQYATANVIPDPDTTSAYNFQGCKLAYKNGTDNSEGYLLYLPPKGPLDTRNINNGPQVYGGVMNGDNFDASPDTNNGIIKTWQRDNIDAATSVATKAAQYRYALPRIITQNYSAGATIPTGLIYLYDATGTNTIIEGITIKATDPVSPYTLEISGDAMDTWVINYASSCYPANSLDTYATDHSATYYPSTGLRVITPGTSITESLDTLTKNFYEHDHGTSNILKTRPIQHTSIDGLAKIRTHVINPCQFQVYDINTNDCNIYSNASYPTIVNNQSTGYANPIGYLNPSEASINLMAFAPITLPYSRYVITDIGIAIASATAGGSGHALTDNIWYVGMSFSQFTRSGGAFNFTVDSTFDAIDLFSTVPFSSINSTDWTALTFLTDGTSNFYVDNNCDTATYYRSPTIYLIANNTNGGANTLSIYYSPVVIKYRILEL